MTSDLETEDGVQTISRLACNGRYFHYIGKGIGLLDFLSHRFTERGKRWGLPLNVTTGSGV